MDELVISVSMKRYKSHAESESLLNLKTMCSVSSSPLCASGCSRDAIGFLQPPASSGRSLDSTCMMKQTNWFFFSYFSHFLSSFQITGHCYICTLISTPSALIYPSQNTSYVNSCVPSIISCTLYQKHILYLCIYLYS